MPEWKRIAIIGCSGAGKSTLARRLAAITALPLIHLDAEFWKPGWVETPRQLWREQVGRLLAGEQWIIDGNFGSLQELSMAAADMGRGCPEKVDFEFLEYVWNFNEVSRPKIFERLAKVRAEHKLVRLSTPRQVEAFVKEMETQ